MPVARLSGPGFLALAVLLPWSALLLLPPHPINHDVAWFYYVASGVLHGGTLYRDFIEPNAPMASLSLVPAVWLSQFLAVGPGLAVELWVLTIASIALAMAGAVFSRLYPGPALRLFALLALTIAFAFLPKANFGQREHILAMLLTPYVLACAAALCGVRLVPALAATIGAAASFAVVLKPPFLLVPAALEMLLLWRAGRRWRPRLESLSMAVCLGIMAAITVLFFPLYVREVVPWAAALYAGYNQPRGVALCVAAVADAGIIVWLGWSRPDATARALRLCLAIATLAALAAFAVQNKGWSYQLFPAGLLLFLMNAGAVATTPFWPGRSWTTWVAWLPPRILAGVFLYYLVNGQAVTVDMRRFADTAKIIDAQPGPFLILSTNVVPAFPLALYTGRVWASRTPCLIMLPGLVAAERKGIRSDWERPYRAWIAEDLQRYRPAVVFVPNGPQQALPADFDVLAWLLRDPAFAAAWAHYHLDGTIDGMRLFRLS